MSGIWRIGWIGTGVMGRSMCEHLLRAGYGVTVFNRTPEKYKSLLEIGAVAARSPKEVAENSDVVFSIVGFPSDVREVMLGESGVIKNMRIGGIVVDMTTSEPSLAKLLAETALSSGVHFLDAPVSGGDIGAKNATLSIMVGGNMEAYISVLPYLNVLGKNIRRLGDSGSGQHTKMMNQIIISTNMIGIVEGLLYAYKAGLDLNETIAAVETGAAGSWSISNYGPRIVARNFQPGGFVEHFVKDLGIALKEAELMNLSLPGLALSHQLFVSLKAQGHGKLGTQSLMLAFEKMNNIDCI
eukprot:gene7521-15401_t